MHDDLIFGFTFGLNLLYTETDIAFFCLEREKGRISYHFNIEFSVYSELIHTCENNAYWHRLMFQINPLRVILYWDFNEIFDTLYIREFWVFIEFLKKLPRVRIGSR